MKLKENILQVNVQLQDEARKKIASLGLNALDGSAVMLGDSDIDYNLIAANKKARILSAPYGSATIKYPLLFNGSDNSIKGKISTYVRKIVSVDSGNGKALSLYNYPLNDNFTDGSTVPTLENGKDFSSLPFDTQGLLAEGYVVYVQTVLDYYFDENNKNLRLLEEYEVKTFNSSMNEITLNSYWDISEDKKNGSFLISKLGVTSNNNGFIRITGKTSNQTKLINFNY